MFDADREARFRGEPPAMIPVVAEDPLAPSALPTPDSWTWFTETGSDARTVLAQRGHAAHASRCSGSTSPASTSAISPTPLLMVVAAGDHLTAADLAIAPYERAREPKQLVILPGGHFDAYVDGLRGLHRARPRLVRRAPRALIRARRWRQSVVTLQVGDRALQHRTLAIRRLVGAPGGGPGWPCRKPFGGRLAAAALLPHVEAGQLPSGAEFRHVGAAEVFSRTALASACDTGSTRQVVNRWQVLGL